MDISILAFGLGWVEMVVIMGVGLVIFGRRLPQVARDLGRSVVSFRKGLTAVEEEIEDAAHMEDQKAEYEAHLKQVDEEQTLDEKKQADKPDSSKDGETSAA